MRRPTISPLPKVKVVHELGGVRLVSLTQDLGKVLEGIVTRVMLTLLSDIRGSIDERQYGNLKGRSTSHYLIYLFRYVFW